FVAVFEPYEVVVPYSTYHEVATPPGLTVPVTVAVDAPTALTGPVTAVGAAACAPPAAASSAAAVSRKGMPCRRGRGMRLSALSDPRQRVLPVLHRAVDLGTVVEVELRVHVCRHGGRDGAGQPGDRDRGGRERGDRAACLALLGLRLGRCALARPDLDGGACGGATAELAAGEAAGCEG